MTHSRSLREAVAIALFAALLAVVVVAVVGTLLVLDGVIAGPAALAVALLTAQLLRRPVGVAMGRLVDRGAGAGATRRASCRPWLPRS